MVKNLTVLDLSSSFHSSPFTLHSSFGCHAQAAVCLGMLSKTKFSILHSKSTPRALSIRGRLKDEVFDMLSVADGDLLGADQDVGAAGNFDAIASVVQVEELKARLGTRGVLDRRGWLRSGWCPTVVGDRAVSTRGPQPDRFCSLARRRPVPSSELAAGYDSRSRAYGWNSGSCWKPIRDEDRWWLHLPQLLRR